MTWLDSGIRLFLLAQGTAARWLREEISALKVRIRLTDGCIEELAREADHAAHRASVARPGGQAPGEGVSYVELLREQVMLQADWVRRWTTTDEKPPADDAVAQAFVRIARKYALPRPWKLSEPVAVAVDRPRPSWAWAAGLHPQAAGH